MILVDLVTSRLHCMILVDLVISRFHCMILVDVVISRFHCMILVDVVISRFHCMVLVDLVPLLPVNDSIRNYTNVSTIYGYATCMLYLVNDVLL